MPTVEDKKNILNKIAVLNTINGGLPKFKLNNSLPSINNKENVIAFLIDVMTVLGIAKSLIKEIKDFLLYNVPLIEKEIKEELKELLKEYVSCKSNPEIPLFILNSGAGIKTELKTIDFYDVFKINPKSTIGSITYNDNYSGIDSSDLNTFLYETIQTNIATPGTSEEWTGSNDNPVMEFTFNQTGGSTNNELVIKASNYYSDSANGKTLIDLNNDFIDSIELFAPDKLLSSIMDTLYGVFTFNLNKSQSQLVSEQELDNIITNLINENSDEIDDSFFTFNNTEQLNNENLAKERKNGIRKLVTCGNLESSLDSNSLINDLNAISGATNNSSLNVAITNALTNVLDNASSNAAPQDQDNVKENIIQDIIKAIAGSLIKTIISPKMVVMFMINHKIVYGETESWNSGVDFLMKNKTIMKKITNKARELVIQVLLSLIVKVVTALIRKNLDRILKERVVSNKAVLLSLFGVSQNVLRLIKGLR